MRAERRGTGIPHADGHVRLALIENEDRIRPAVRGIRAMFKADGVVPGA